MSFYAYWMEFRQPDNKSWSKEVILISKPGEALRDTIDAGGKNECNIDDVRISRLKSSEEFEENLVKVPIFTCPDYHDQGIMFQDSHYSYEPFENNEN